MTNDFKVIDEQFEAGKSAITSYVIGFIFSIIFTLVPYILVVSHTLVSQTAIFVVVSIAVLQFLVQVVYFLHLSKKSNPKWNLIVFVYSVLMVVILVVGSMWIMYNLNYNMTTQSPLNTIEGYIPTAENPGM